MSKVDPYLVTVLPWYRSAHRKRLAKMPFPERWERILRRNVAHYPLLNDEERSRLRTDLRILVSEKNWDGCDSLKITEEIRVTIAAQAALMLLGITHDYFKHVPSIVVFPTMFELLREESRDEEDKEFASGLASYEGAVLLSWDCALAESRDPSTGHNLVIHEFAHQLDFMDGLFDGVPPLRGIEQTTRWSSLMQKGFARLQRELSEEDETFLGDHAGTNATEFFAALSERFFTVPAQLRAYNADLYRILLEYYGVDPLVWFTQPLPKRSIGSQKSP